MADSNPVIIPFHAWQKKRRAGKGSTFSCPRYLRGHSRLKPGDLPLRLPLAQAAAGVLIALAQHQEQRAGNVDRAVGADHYADHHHEGEQMNAWYHYLLHNQTAAVIKAYLLFSGFRRVVVINVPWYLSE